MYVTPWLSQTKAQMDSSVLGGQGCQLLSVAPSMGGMVEQPPLSVGSHQSSQCLGTGQDDTHVNTEETFSGRGPGSEPWARERWWQGRPSGG